MNALITGGSRGIGAATVLHFVQNGWRVAFFYQKSDAQARALSEKTGAIALFCDVARSAEVNAATERALAHLGQIDALVNCAGASLFNLVTDTTDDAWRGVQSVNLDGAFFTMRAVLPGMLQRKAGAIVNVSSIWGRSGASCESAYSAAKAGLIGLTQAAARELGPSGIRVNCVAPGLIETDMNAHLTAQDLRDFAGDTPLQRMGAPAEVAEAIEFLCSSRSSFITGQTLGVDGGYIA